ncbi:Ada metal-binding domain-containing protein [Mucilaginibacter myungsuensis]|uniref:Metal-binding protein n=1 Tax=Mucilaginibacter myungsuensis TaxID=649104 RepID=A0A929KVU5_9SPHI|nr:Ada metal-binding domain-containing protein [Mucilaginibacter myungsuensis]MBE9662544.1 metal-binding protein [Mucilaginibacter myungsuensis]MDN3597963.1 Ada metal-binding domain-containing protein [Mucilaginibacter myungsuensis]
MVKHVSLGDTDFVRTSALAKLILTSQIRFGGNSKLMIYGRLDCRSSKRMKVSNRVFFKDGNEALSFGYRPCGHCMLDAYKTWKRMQVVPPVKG